LSQRSIRRAQQRRLAKERRRETLTRRRAGLAVTAALSAAAFVAPAAASANNYVVTTTNDGPAAPCDPSTNECDTLRSAIGAANVNPGDDTITFASGLTGTITLSSGQLPINASGGGLAIQGPGAGNLTIAGYTESPQRLFDIQGSGNPVSISGVTLTGGDAGTSGGGAIRQGSGLQNAAAPLTVSNAVISGNNAGGGGGAILSYGSLAVSNTTISGNTGGFGAGIASGGKYAQMNVADSTISGNKAKSAGGGIEVFQTYKYSESSQPVKHAVKSEISGTTIAGNSADYGAGIAFAALGDGDHFTITHSTISGNDAASSDANGFGGGIAFADEFAVPSVTGIPIPIPLVTTVNWSETSPIDGEFRTIDTTISGNTADTGGGVAVGGHNEQAPPSFTRLSAPYYSVIGPDGSIEFDNSTIASNSATGNGGGVFLSGYELNAGDASTISSPTIQLTSTILGDNNASGAANDADRADGSGGGGLDTSFSLVENPGDSPVSQTPGGSSLIGVDPQLAPLGDNGGSTQTQLPANTSPVIDKGNAPARLLDDQRGHARTVDGGGVSNASGGDGTDIGAVEIDNPAGPVVFVPNTPAAPGDTIAPKITLKVPKSLSIRQLIAGFNVRVTCNEACAMTFRLYGSAPTGTLHSAGYNFRLLNRKIGRKGGTRRVHLRPCIAGSSSSKRTHVCRKRITAALYAKPQKSFKVKLIVAAKDKAGNISHVKRFIRVHR
jgi:hypothetical protein